jgi:hypothetical protein
LEQRRMLSTPPTSLRQARHCPDWWLVQGRQGHGLFESRSPSRLSLAG